MAVEENTEKNVPVVMLDAPQATELVKYAARLWYLAVVAAFGVGGFFAVTQWTLSDIRREFAEQVVETRAYRKSMEKRMRAQEAYSARAIGPEAEVRLDSVEQWKMKVEREIGEIKTQLRDD